MELPNINDIDGILGMLKKISSRDNEVVIKSIPMKKEWIKMTEDGLVLATKMAHLEDELKNTKKKMWAMIELDLNDFNTHKRINHEEKLVEFMGEEKKDKLVKSPFQKM